MTSNLFSFSLVLGFIPSIDSMSWGDGKYSQTASRSGWTPLFLSEDPARTGTILYLMTAALRAFLSSSFEISFPNKGFAGNQINNAHKIIFFADRQIIRNGRRA